MKPGSLLYLFNVELVDFVRQLPDGTYVPVEWPKDATHELHPTKWNNPRDYKPNGHGKIQMPDGYALSVCAEPLVRRGMLARGRAVKIRRELPAERPAYLADGGVAGKRSVLWWMVQQMKADVTKRFVLKATSEQCDTLYRNLMVANFYFED